MRLFSLWHNKSTHRSLNNIVETSPKASDSIKLWYPHGCVHREQRLSFHRKERAFSRQNADNTRRLLSFSLFNFWKNNHGTCLCISGKCSNWTLKNLVTEEKRWQLAMYMGGWIYFVHFGIQRCFGGMKSSFNKRLAPVLTRLFDQLHILVFLYYMYSKAPENSLNVSYLDVLFQFTFDLWKKISRVWCEHKSIGIESDDSELYYSFSADWLASHRVKWRGSRVALKASFQSLGAFFKPWNSLSNVKTIVSLMISGWERCSNTHLIQRNFIGDTTM